VITTTEAPQTAAVAVMTIIMIITETVAAEATAAVPCMVAPATKTATVPKTTEAMMITTVITPAVPDWADQPAAPVIFPAEVPVTLEIRAADIMMKVITAARNIPDSTEVLTSTTEEAITEAPTIMAAPANMEIQIITETVAATGTPAAMKIPADMEVLEITDQSMIPITTVP